MKKKKTIDNYCSHGITLLGTSDSMPLVEMGCQQPSFSVLCIQQRFKIIGFLKTPVLN